MRYCSGINHGGRGHESLSRGGSGRRSLMNDLSIPQLAIKEVLQSRGGSWSRMNDVLFFFSTGNN